jgi:hypothetical protein
MTIGQGYRRWLTPRAQEALATSCNVLIDAFFDEWRLVESWKPESILSTRLGKHLPRHFSQNYTPHFYKRFGVCVVTVAWKLAQPKPQPLASRAEQLAACAIVEEAREMFKGASGEEAAQAFQAFLDGYVEHSNVCSLFDPPDHGIDAGPGEHMASLALEHWFRPFSGKYAAHPYAFGGANVLRVGQAYKKHLLPSEQEALDAGIAVLIDELFEDFTPSVSLRTGGNSALTTLGEHLPLHYLPKYTSVFLKQFAVCIMTVAWKLAQPRHVPLSSVAEELAAHAILTQAQGCLALELESAEEDEGDEEITAEQAFEDFREYYFEDEDFLFLFDNSYDGVETSPVGQMLHMTSLAFADWFRPFSADPARIAHPYVFGQEP